MWTNVKTAVHSHLSSSGVTVARDGKNDSPGHTAHYCVYTPMEETTRMAVDIQVTGKRETGGKSAAMEKLAMSRLLQRSKGVLTISHVVTDAFTSIKALVKDMKVHVFLFFYYCNLALQYYRKIHYLTREFHVKFHAKNRYCTNREAMSAISVFQVKFNVEFTSQVIDFP